MFLLNTKKPKSILLSFSLMQKTDKNWLDPRENLLTKDVKKSLNLRKKYVKVMINHLLLLMKKVSTLFVCKCLPTKIFLHYEEPRGETCKELFWHVVEVQLIQSKD